MALPIQGKFDWLILPKIGRGLHGHTIQKWWLQEEKVYYSLPIFRFQINFVTCDEDEDNWSRYEIYYKTMGNMEKYRAISYINNV